MDRLKLIKNQLMNRNERSSHKIVICGMTRTPITSGPNGELNKVPLELLLKNVLINLKAKSNVQDINIIDDIYVGNIFMWNDKHHKFNQFYNFK